MKATDVKMMADACEGELLGNRSAIVYNVEIDSRRVGPGYMFVAVIGENKNGHDYAADAFNAGCRIFLLSESLCADELIGLDPSVCVILTKDTVVGFVAIAKAYLSRFELRRIALTGSVGKTTTKEMIACVLASKYKTVYTQNNYNTQLGQCLTAFLADDETEAIVFEMGMDRKGEISEYCEWILPDIAVITNIGTAHLERLGSREAIASAKLEIAERLKEDQPLIVNSDSDFLSPARVRHDVGNTCILCSVGKKREFDFCISDVSHSAEGGISFNLSEKSSGSTQGFMLPLLGVHNAVNASLAVAVGRFMHIPMSLAAQALAHVQSPNRRLSLLKVNEITIIDDTYNAGPDSIKAAIDTMSMVDGNRTLAILSDILELGPLEREGHMDVGRYAAEQGIDLLFAIGERAKYYSEGALAVNKNMRVFHYDTKEAAFSDILSTLQAGDVVLIKGSNATKISELVHLLKDAIEQRGRGK